MVTYRLDYVLGSLHTQQLYGFDELCNVQGIIQNCSAKTNIIVALLYSPASYFSFRIIRQSKMNRANGKWQIVFFDRSVKGQDNLNKAISMNILVDINSSYILKRFAYELCVCISRLYFSKQVLRNSTLKNTYFRFQKE
jgi:hypothetical protein